MKRFTLFATLLLSGLLFFSGCSDSSGGSDSDNPVESRVADATSVNTTLSALSPVEINTNTIIVVTLADSSGNLLIKGGDTVTMNSSSTTALIAAVIDNGDGTYTVTTSNHVAETVTFTGTVNGTIITSTADIVFVDSGAVIGAADATNINTTLSVLSPVEINTDTIIVVTLADSSGKLLIEGDDNVTMSSNPATTISAVTDNGNGTYSFTTSNPLAETVTFTGTVNEATITSTKDITFVDSSDDRDADASKTTFSANLTTLPVYTYTTITVTLKDIDGIALTQGGDDVTLTAASSSVHVGLLDPTDNGDGTYTFTVTLERDLVTDETKKITYTALVNGVASPLESGILITYTEAVLVIGDANATTSVVEATTPVVANGTAITTITVTLKDSAGTSLITGEDNVTMTGTGSSVISLVTDNLNGTYTATATNEVNETVTYTGTVNEVIITDTAIVEFTDPTLPDITNPLTTVVAVPDTNVIADASTQTTITVTLVDGNGDATAGGADVNLTSSSATSVPSIVTDTGGGTYTFTATNTVAETVTYTAELDGVFSTNTASVEFVAGAADATKSTVTGTPAEVLNDGVAEATLTVTLVDSMGNTITTENAHNVTMDSNSSTALISIVAANTDGTYTFTVDNNTSGVIENVAFTASVEGVSITDTAEVLFTDNPASIVPADYVGNTVTFAGFDGKFSFYINNTFVKATCPGDVCADATGEFEYIGSWDEAAIYDDKGDLIAVESVDTQKAIFHYTMLNLKVKEDPAHVQGFALREKLATRIEFVHFSDPPNQDAEVSPTNPTFVWMYGYNTETNSSSEGHAKANWNAVDGKIVASLGDAEFQTYAFDRGSVEGSIVTITKNDELLKVIVIGQWYELHPSADSESAVTPVAVVATDFDGKMMTINSKLRGPASRYFEERAFDDGSYPEEDVQDGRVDGIIWAVGISDGIPWGGKGDHWNIASDDMSLLIKVHYDGDSGTPEKLEFDTNPPVGYTGVVGTFMSRWEEGVRNSNDYNESLGTSTIDQFSDF